MSEQTNVKELEKVVIRFSGDSGDGMQLAGNLFSNISAAIGNEISTFPDEFGTSSSRSHHISCQRLFSRLWIR